MNVLGSGEIIAVIALAVHGEAFLYKVDGHVQEDVEIWLRKFKVTVLGMEDPVPEGIPPGAFGQFGALVGDIGVHIAVQQNRFALLQSLLDARARAVTVFGKKEGDQLRMHLIVGPEVSAKETGNEVSVDRSLITGKMNVFQTAAALQQIFFQQCDLGGFSRPVQSFKYDEHNISMISYKDTKICRNFDL